MVIALVTASTVFGIHHFNLKHMRKLENDYSFYDKLHKAYRKRNSPVVRLYAYPKDLALCIVKWRIDTNPVVLCISISGNF